MKKELLYFLFGLFFISIYETVATWLEYLKITPSKKILKGKGIF